MALQTEDNAVCEQPIGIPGVEDTDLLKSTEIETRSQYEAVTLCGS